MHVFNLMPARYATALALLLIAVNNVYAASTSLTPSIQLTQPDAAPAAQDITTVLDRVSGSAEYQTLQLESMPAESVTRAAITADTTVTQARLDTVKNLLNQADATSMQQAIATLAELSQQGNAEAQLILGKMHINGEGVNKNIPAAAKLLLASAEAGNTDAMLIVAHLYQSGNGFEKNQAAARNWQQRAYSNPANKTVTNNNRTDNYLLPGTIISFGVIASIWLYWLLFKSRTIFTLKMNSTDQAEIWNMFIQECEVFLIKYKSWKFVQRNQNGLQLVISRILVGTITIQRVQSHILVELCGLNALFLLGKQINIKQIHQEIDYLYTEAVTRHNNTQSELAQSREIYETAAFNDAINSLSSHLEHLHRSEPDIFRNVQKLFNLNAIPTDNTQHIKDQLILNLLEQYSQCLAANQTFNILKWQPLKDLIAGEMQALTATRSRLLARIEAVYFYPCMSGAALHTRNKILSKISFNTPIADDLNDAELLACAAEVSWMLEITEFTDQLFDTTDAIKHLAENINEFLALSSHPLLTDFFPKQKLLDIHRDFYALIDSNISSSDLQHGLNQIAALLHDLPGFMDIKPKGKAVILMAINATPTDNPHYTIEIIQRVHKAYGVSLTDRPDEHGDRSITGTGNHLFKAMTFVEYIDWKSTRNYLQRMLQNWINHAYPLSYQTSRTQLGQTTTIGEAELIKQDMENLHTIKNQCQQIIGEYINADAQRSYELNATSTTLRSLNASQNSFDTLADDQQEVAATHQRVYLRTG